MDLDTMLKRLSKEQMPSSEAQLRVRARMERRISGPALLQEAKRRATPAEGRQEVLWQRVFARISSPVLQSWFERLRTILTPAQSSQARIKMQMLERLSPAARNQTHAVYKWAAAFAVVALLLRTGPLIFLSPQTEAESSVILSPTKGTVSVSLHGLWQPVGGEIVIKEGLPIRTDTGEATIMLHDDGNIRLSQNTSVRLHDVSDRPEPALDGNTLTVQRGELWVQGMLPNHLRGITIATPAGDVVVHGGSVSLQIADTVTVRVWDRHAKILHNGEQIVLVAGEETELWHGNVPVIAKIADEELDNPWTAQNIDRDAVHRREIAQLQQERRAAKAGILPSSPLYTVKRVAETVDVLFTLNPEEKVQKKLQHASTRLSEAAAMIVNDATGATVPLQEYKDTLLAVASGTGGDSVTQFLIRQEVAENAAEFAAALPDDDSYLLKKTVLEASAELPEEMVDESDVEGMILVDTLDVLQNAIDSGDAAQVEETYRALEPYLDSLEDEERLKPEVKKEALSILTTMAESLAHTGSGSIPAITNQLEEYLPVPEKPAVVARALSDEEVQQIVDRSMHVIFVVYKMPQSRENALRTELRSYAQYGEDEGRILRRLLEELPENSELRNLVRRAIQLLREAQLAR